MGDKKAGLGRRTSWREKLRKTLGKTMCGWERSKTIETKMLGRVRNGLQDLRD